MTIPVMSSQELNEIYIKARDNSNEVGNKINNMKQDASKKLSILRYQTEYINKVQNSIGTGISDPNIIAFDHTSLGNFNDYGSSVHAKFTKTPIDLFNMKLLNGSSMFRDDVFVKVNDIEKEEYKNLLLADNNINKKIVFEEFFSDIVTVEIELDRTNILGSSRFNMIEIDPYMHGAYDILSTNIYTVDLSGKIENEPAIVLNGFDNISRTRLLLPSKKKFYKITIDFKINFKSLKADQEVYPFGLKHLYFYEADFNPNSFVIAEFRSDKFIEYVNDDIKLFTTQGAINTTISEYGIEMYTDYSGNTLNGRVYPSTEAVKNRIAKNTKKLYVKIPLVIFDKSTNKIKDYLCLNGIHLDAKTFEEIIL